MKAKIVGKAPHYEGAKSKTTGKPYSVQTLYLTYNPPGIEGCAVMEQLINYLDFPQAQALKVGDNISLDYNDKGKLLGVEAIKV
jgi:uncharacterized protein YuzE